MSNEKPLMKCGHIANALTGDNKPCCVICECYEEAQQKVDVSGRMMKCSCGKTEPSNPNAAFFEYKPNSDFDSFYCGCWGWD